MALPAIAPATAPPAVATLRRPWLSVLRRSSSLPATAPTTPPSTGPTTLGDSSTGRPSIRVTVPQLWHCPAPQPLPPAPYPGPSPPAGAVAPPARATDPD